MKVAVHRERAGPTKETGYSRIKTAKPGPQNVLTVIEDNAAYQYSHKQIKIFFRRAGFLKLMGSKSRQHGII